MVFLQHRTFYTPSPLVTSSLSPLEDAVVANLESSQSAMSCGEGGGKQVRSRNTICLWVWLPRQRRLDHKARGGGLLGSTWGAGSFPLHNAQGLQSLPAETRGPQELGECPS